MSKNLKETSKQNRQKTQSTETRKNYFFEKIGQLSGQLSGL